MALEHAWKVHACLPIKSLLKDDKPISPYEYFYGIKPCIRRFRGLFCPCVVKIDQRHDSITDATLSRKNSPERGIRSIYVGLPQNSAGYLVYIPSTGTILVSSDVVFDEDFISTVVYQDPRLPGGVPLQPPSLPPPEQDQIVHTTENPTLVASSDNAIESTKEPFLKNITKPDEVEEYFSEKLLPLVEGESYTQDFKQSQISNDSTTANNKTSYLRRSKRLKAVKQVYNASLQTDITFDQSYAELRQALAASLLVSS